MPFCKTSGPGPPGPFFLANVSKEQPQQGGLAGAAELRRCRVGTRRDYKVAGNNFGVTKIQARVWISRAVTIGPHGPRLWSAVG